MEEELVDHGWVFNRRVDGRGGGRGGSRDEGKRRIFLRQAGAELLTGLALAGQAARTGLAVGLFFCQLAVSLVKGFFEQAVLKGGGYGLCVCERAVERERERERER